MSCLGGIYGSFKFGFFIVKLMLCPSDWWGFSEGGGDSGVFW